MHDAHALTFRRREDISLELLCSVRHIPTDTLYLCSFAWVILQIVSKRKFFIKRALFQELPQRAFSINVEMASKFRRRNSVRKRKNILTSNYTHRFDVEILLPFSTLFRLMPTGHTISFFFNVCIVLHLNKTPCQYK